MKTTITPAGLKQLLNKGIKPMLLDVRSQEEYSENHLPLAIHVPLETIETGHFVPEPGKIMVTICGKGGGRSERAANYLRKNFSNEVYFLEGGTQAWFS